MSPSSKKGKSKKRKNSQTPNSDEQTKRQVPNMASPIVYGAASDNNNQHSLSPKEDTPQSYMASPQFTTPQQNQHSYTTTQQGNGYPQVWSMTPGPTNPNQPVHVPTYLTQQGYGESYNLQPLTNVNQTQLHPANASEPGTPHYIMEINKKLDYVISKVSKIDELEQQFSAMNNDILLIKQQQTVFDTSLSFLADKFDEHTLSYNRVNEKLTIFDRESKRLSEECKSIQDTVTDLQTRSMRDNLLFTGITEEENAEKTCEEVLKDFIKKELKIDCNRMEFERVHRIGKRDNQFAGGRPRPIVARFSRFKDRESIRQAAPRELRGKPFGINEQFPKCVVERRKRLLPAFKKSRQNPMIRSSLIGDKLFINGRQLTEQEVLDYVDGRSTPGHDTAQPIQGGPPPNLITRM